MSGTVERWLAFAREDQQMAELALREGIYNQACFHAQQCVEKALKAALAHRTRRTPPRTHAIADLLTLLPADWLTEVRAGLLETMDDYYIPTRYPDALPGAPPDSLPGQSEADEAVALARVVLEQVSRLAGSNQ